MELRRMGSLTGLKMLDLSRLLPGAYGSLLLADMGMEVLKVEDLDQGDYMRKQGSIRKKETAQFLALNRNKKSMTLDLKSKEGKEIFYELAKKSDASPSLRRRSPCGFALDHVWRPRRLQPDL